MEKKIDVKNFVNGYVKTAEVRKDQYLKSHVTENYLSYSTKTNNGMRLAKACYFSKNVDTNIKEFRYNTTGHFMMYCLSIVDNYTDINVDYNNAVECYDLLTKYDLINLISEKIPASELKEFFMVAQSCKEDEINNYQEIHSYITNSITTFSETLGIALKPGLDKLIDVIENMDEKTINSISNKIIKLVNRK